MHWVGELHAGLQIGLHVELHGLTIDQLQPFCHLDASNSYIDRGWNQQGHNKILHSDIKRT